MRVRFRDGYPATWPADPAGWLSPPALLAAWVAEDASVVQGHVALVGAVVDPVLVRAAARPRDSLAAVSRLFVGPSARGAGCGGALLAAAGTHARDRGLRLVLDVVDSGGASPAVALYERLGWRLVGRRPAGWRSPDGARSVLRLYVLDPDRTQRGRGHSR